MATPASGSVSAPAPAVFRLGLDLDGVLCRFAPAFTRLLIQVSGRDLLPAATTPETYEPAVWGWPTALGYRRSEIIAAWDVVNASAHFWRALEPADGAVVLLLWLQRQIAAGQIAVTFVTSRPGETAHVQSVDWLRQYGIEQPHVVITGGISKGGIACALRLDVLVDDYVENLISVAWQAAELQRECRAVCFDAPYNQDWEGERITRLDQVRDLVAAGGESGAVLPSFTGSAEAAPAG